MEKKSDMEIYQNAQFCYERANMEENSVRRFQEVFREVFRSLTHIWKTCIFKPWSEKLAYPKTFRWLQKEKMSGILDICTLIEHKKKSRYPKLIDLHLKEWDENHVIKNLQKQDKLVRWDKKMKNSYKVWCFQV